MRTPTPRRTRADGRRSRETILRAAANLATVDGLEGISIGNLAAHIGMSKSGLYAHFGSKEELQLATVETAKQIFETVVVAPTESIEDPLERVEALVEEFLGHIERRVFPGGCFFISVTNEFGTRPGPVRDRIAEINAEWSSRMQGLLEQAREQREISPDEDVREIQFELDAYMMMGNTAFVMTGDASFLRQARESVDRRLAYAR